MLDAANAAVARPAGSVDGLVELAAQDMLGVNAIISARMQSPVSVIPALADHLINAAFVTEVPMTNRLDTNSLPIIFLAFANDRDDRTRYLRNLAEEARRLREALAPAERAGLCQVVVRQNATVREIFDVFQDAQTRNRVAVFHYAGHADSYELLLTMGSGEWAGASRMSTRSGEI